MAIDDAGRNALDRIEFFSENRPAIVDGRPGAVVVRGGQVFSVVAFTIVDDRVVGMDLLVDPVKLRNVRV